MSILIAPFTPEQPLCWQCALILYMPAGVGQRFAALQKIKQSKTKMSPAEIPNAQVFLVNSF